MEDNSVATAVFHSTATQLAIESEVIIQQYNQSPLDFLVAEYAKDHPFNYTQEDRGLLTPYLEKSGPMEEPLLSKWIAGIRGAGKPMQTYALLNRLSSHIHQTLSYRVREEPGVQTPEETLLLRTGSCRDFAALLMAAARRLGLAARFVSGYLHSRPSTVDFGATHAWAEVYLPGAGWKGFDPTSGELAGTNHIPVAVARNPESVPPVSGTFVGPPGASLSVGVWVTELAHHSMTNN